MVDSTNSELLENNDSENFNKSSHISSNDKIKQLIKSKTVEKVDELINQKKDQFIQYQKDDQ